LEEFFLRCFWLTATSGTCEADNYYPDTRYRLVCTYYSDCGVAAVPGQIPRKSTLIVDKAGGFVWTFFTTASSRAPDTNDWVGCTDTYA
jgi:hypothetical protein